MGADSDGEEEDEIVREIDVFVNRVDDVELYLLQYPLRPIYRPYGDQGELKSVEIKRQQRRVKISYRVNKDSDYYEEMPIAYGSGKEGEQPFDHVLVSRPVPNCFTSYALGFYSENCLHICPLDCVSQFRPTFTHMDKMAENAQLPQVTADPPLGSREKGEESSAGVVEVEVTYKRRETEKQQRDVRMSYARLREVEESESWAPLVCHLSDSHEASEITEQICTPKRIYKSRGGDEDEDMMDSLGVEVGGSRGLLQSVLFTPGVQAYVDELCGLHEPLTNSDPDKSAQPALETQRHSVAPGPLSYVSLSRLSLEAQVRRIMTHLQITTFSKILSLISYRPEDEMELVNLLLEISVLVHGNWVIKSQLALEGDGYETLCRDLLLLLLQLHRKVNRVKFVEAVGLPSERVTALFNQVAVFSQGLWMLKLPEDVAFKERFPKIVATSEKEWAERQESLLVQIARKHSSLQSRPSGGGDR